MASIQIRKGKDGILRFRVRIRKKNLKPVDVTFFSIEDAEDFIEMFEEEYILNGQDIILESLRVVKQGEHQKGYKIE